MEILKNITETANERLKSPFIASFIFAWLAFKWEAIAVILAGGGTMQERITEVNEDYLQWTDNWWTNLVLPLSIALFYAIVFPWIVTLFEKATAKARVTSDKTKHARRKEELLFKKETALIEFETAQGKEGKNAINKHLSTISSLEEKNSELMNDFNELEEEFSEIRESLSISSEKLQLISKAIRFEENIEPWFRMDEEFTYLDGFFKRIKNDDLLHVLSRFGLEIYKLPNEVFKLKNEDRGHYEYLELYGLINQSGDRLSWTNRAMLYAQMYLLQNDDLQDVFPINFET